MVMALDRDKQQAKPKSLPYKSIARHTEFPAGGGLRIRLSLDLGPGLFVSQQQLNDLYVGSPADSLDTIVHEGISIVVPKLRGVIRPHQLTAQRADAADAEDADDESFTRFPVLKPVGKVKSDPATIRRERRERRIARESHRTARIVARAERDQQILNLLEDRGFGRQTVHHCGICKFRCFSQRALDSHVCDRLGQRTIRGRTRPSVLKRRQEAADAAGAKATSDQFASCGGDPKEGGAIPEMPADVEGVEDRNEMFVASSCESEDGTESEHSFAHSDDCANDVDIMVIEEVSDDEGEPSAEVPGVGVLSAQDAFGLGSCRYPTARRGQKMPAEVIDQRLTLFPLKLKGPQVLELLELKYPAQFIEDNDITARRIKNWQGAESQRRVKAAKQVASQTGGVGSSSGGSDFTNLSVAVLKEQLKSKGLRTSGPKAELVARLQQDEEARKVVQALENANPSSISKKRSADATPVGHLPKRSRGRGGGDDDGGSSSCASGLPS